MKANGWMGKGDVQVLDVPEPKIINRRDAIVTDGELARRGWSGHARAQGRTRDFAPLLERIEQGHIDPTFIITHRLPLEQAARGFEIFGNKEHECIKVVLKPGLH
jgi:threonine dehydrogenase-like Zn-dependent dehydrogenase